MIGWLDGGEVIETPFVASKATVISHYTNPQSKLALSIIQVFTDNVTVTSERLAKASQSFPFQIQNLNLEFWVFVDSLEKVDAVFIYDLLPRAIFSNFKRISENRWASDIDAVRFFIFIVNWCHKISQNLLGSNDANEWEKRQRVGWIEHPYWIWKNHALPLSYTLI